MTSAAVSVVIPTHNRRSLLLRTLRTVLGQQGVAVEVFVVDDGSTDGTTEVVRAMGDDRVAVIRHERSVRVAAARNAGLACASHPWVAFVDDDDLWAPDKLVTQLRAAEAVASAGWVCAGAVTVDEQLNVLSGQTTPQPEDVKWLVAYNIIPGGGSGTIVRTDLARSVGGFDCELSNTADWDMWIRLSLHAPLAMAPRPLTGYLRHPRSLSHDPTGVRNELDRIASKYAGVRAERAIRDSPRTLAWFAHRQVHARERRRAITMYAQLARHGKPKAWLWAVAAGLSPSQLSLHRDRRSRRLLPAGWKDEADRWLAPLRAPAATRASIEPAPLRVGSTG